MDDVPASLLVMQLEHVRIALPLDAVLRVVRAAEPTYLPGAPASVLGAVNIAGSVVPVLDLRSRFGLAPRGLLPEDCFVLAQGAGRVVALAVDGVEDVLSLPGQALHPDAICPGTDGVLGVVRREDGLLLVQEPDRFLSLDEAGVLDTAMAAEQARGH